MSLPEKYIAVFCSANDVDKKYTEPAKQFSSLLVKNGYHLVWGGSDEGLMKTVASEVQKAGGKIVGISMEVVKHTARKNANEMIIVKTLGERKALMLERSDAIVMMVGGIGTLDEVMEMVELKKHDLHNKPIVLLNTERFYEGLKMQLEKMRDEGFMHKPLEALVYFADTPSAAIDYINKNLES
jgi:uncharacterized protein (TIGR00730 family)